MGAYKLQILEKGEEEFVKCSHYEFVSMVSKCSKLQLLSWKFSSCFQLFPAAESAPNRWH